jgi:SNF2 family DNA or RNA helicase
LDGVHESYLVINMTLRGTIEEGILKLVERKADLSDAIFGEEGGRRRATGRGGRRNIFEDALEEWAEETGSLKAKKG